MLLNDFLDIEKAISSLKIEDKQKIASNISLLLINSLTNQNTIDSFGLLQRIMSLLIIDNQKKFLMQINNLLISTIVEQESRDLFPAFQRLAQTLSDDKKQQLFSDISLVLQGSLQSMLEAHMTQPIPIVNANTTNPLAALAKGLPIGASPQQNSSTQQPPVARPPQPVPPNPMTTSSAGMMARPPQPIAPPSNLMNTSNGGIMAKPPQPLPPSNVSVAPTKPQPVAPPSNLMSSSNGGMMARPPQPVAPSNLMNTSNSGVVINKTTSAQTTSSGGTSDVVRKSLNSTSSNPGLLNMTTTGGGIRTGTLTGSFNLKGKEEQRSQVSIEEFLGNVSGILIDAGKKALKDFSTPIDLYELLKNIDTNKSLLDIYNSNYLNLNVGQFISKVYYSYTYKQLFLKKSHTFPINKDLRLRIGEWLVILGYIDKEKLSRVVQLHQVSVRNFESLNKRYATKSGANYAGNESKGPMFGNFLVDSDVINRNQLNEALNYQNQFNELVESLK